MTEKKTELENLLTEKQQEMELNLSDAKTISEKQYEEIKQLKKQIESYQKRLFNNLTEKQRLFYNSEIYRYFMSFKNDTFHHKTPTAQEWECSSACSERVFRATTASSRKKTTSRPTNIGFACLPDFSCLSIRWHGF
ncbi:hypothetical protein HMPREF1981_00331 [Bacteroides pyogenes F0041]|uniref:Uncharacterized protein n=1 Tax=Bacteroides pyogenes F0041 TaxID=1321819 RepID=U2CE57_9BACE|nr:hypothetical protein HMPREF1981_00331 [Bacteroides pyogenes F0041]